MFGIEHPQQIGAMVSRKQPELYVHAALLSSGPGTCQYGDMIPVRKEDLPSITVLKGARVESRRKKGTMEGRGGSPAESSQY